MKESDSKISRRRFLQTTAAGVALATVPAWIKTDAEASSMKLGFGQGKKHSANDKINIGLIGAGGCHGGFRMGLGDARNAASKPGVKIVAVCDVDSVHKKQAAEEFGPDTAIYSDFRELLARKDIDAVIIGTPDHWHAYICIAAMKAGKDVYCEKPLTLTIDQGKKLVKVWHDTGAVFQTGSQQRSDARFRLACEAVRNGRVGKLVKVEARLPTGPVGGPFQPQEVPKYLNWDMWCGPTEVVDYMPERCPGSFRWWLDYSGGMLTDWGAHHVDIAQWGLGTDRTGPISVEGTARGPMIGKNCYSTFPEFDVDCIYENGVNLHVTNKGENGVHFQGEEGWIFVNREKIESSDPKLIDEKFPDNAVRLYTSNDHMANFIDGIRTRKQPICDAEIGHRSVSICHMCNISLRLGGRKLNWDPKKEEFINDKDANAMLSRPARKQWKV